MPVSQRRGLLKQADLIFCPYNYIFDPKIAKALQLNFDGAAVVIDEGHNIMDVCRESASTELTLKSVRFVVQLPARCPAHSLRGLD
jgi:Fanconi anemia group J protein